MWSVLKRFSRKADPQLAWRAKNLKMVESAEEAYEMGQQAVSDGNRDLAIGYFKRALQIDPAYTAAIAALGELQFKPPAQPLRSEIQTRNPADVCEVVVQVRNPCNYRCFYCVAAGHNNEPVKLFDLIALQKALSAINAELVVTSFDCGGGEPTVHPQFPDLLRICASHGPVSFPTNNSQDPHRWLPRDLAKRLYIRAAVHPEAEKSLERYARYARHLIDAGCDFSSIFIAHPTRIYKIKEYDKYFSELGIPFTPVSFIGEYDGHHYPHAYTEQEKAMLGLGDENRGWHHKVEPHVTRIRNFRGIPCLAGFRSLYITYEGAVRRCLYDFRKLEAPLKKAEPCGVKNCGCGMLLKEVNVVESADFYNFWAPKVGLPVRSLSWVHERALQLGYPSAQDGLAEENMRMYDELMRAYGKEEFPERNVSSTNSSS